MLHTNCGELALLFDTFCRIWRAGGQATLTTSTKDGQVQANLELQLGLPAAARAGAPSPQQRLSSPSSPGHPGATHRQPCHRGPAAKAKSRARAALHQATKAAAASATVGVTPSSLVATSPNLLEGASSSHPDGASPSAEPTPISGEALPRAFTDPVEATPPLSAPEDAPSPAPGDASSGDAFSPAPGDALSLAPKPSPAPGCDLPSGSGGKTTPSPGDASKFLTAQTFFYRCDVRLRGRGAQPCEKIFSSKADVEAHSKSAHGLDFSWLFCEALQIDSHNNLYIL